MSTNPVNALVRVPRKSGDACVAFTGLDPCPNYCDCHIRQRRLSKPGSAEPHRLPYLAAMAAAKTTVRKPLYEQFRAKGRSRTAVPVSLARRIARIAWSMYTQKTAFDPRRLTAALT